MIKRITNGWNILRMLRLLIGIAAVVQGISQRENVLWIAGSFLLLSAVFDFGCCGSTGCAVRPRAKTTNKEIVYEEVDASK